MVADFDSSKTPGYTVCTFFDLGYDQIKWQKGQKVRKLVARHNAKPVLVITVDDDNDKLLRMDVDFVNGTLPEPPKF